MEVKEINPNSTNPYCIFGIVDSDSGRDIEKEMVPWLKSNYNLIEIWHDGKLFEYPALHYMLEFILKTHKPCLYIHTKGAYNRQELSKNIREMWKYEFTTNRDLYFSLCDRPYSVVSCPTTGSDKTTWYNGFVANYNAMIDIPKIKPYKNRFLFERLFRNTQVQVIGVLRNDLHRELSKIYEKTKKVWQQIKALM